MLVQFSFDTVAFEEAIELYLLKDEKALEYLRNIFDLKLDQLPLKGSAERQFVNEQKALVSSAMNRLKLLVNDEFLTPLITDRLQGSTEIVKLVGNELHSAAVNNQRVDWSFSPDQLLEKNEFLLNPIEVAIIHGSSHFLQSIDLNTTLSISQKVVLKYLENVRRLYHLFPIIWQIEFLTISLKVSDCLVELAPESTGNTTNPLEIAAKRCTLDTVKLLMNKKHTQDLQKSAFIAALHGNVQVAAHLSSSESRKSEPLSFEISAKPNLSNSKLLVNLGHRCNPLIEILDLKEPAILQINSKTTCLEFLIDGTFHEFHLNSVEILNFKLKNLNSETIGHAQLDPEKILYNSMWKEESRSGGRVQLQLYKDYAIVGYLNLEVFIVKPFSTTSAAPATTWKSEKTKLIGHRGLGMNKPFVNSKCKLQLGENTIISFKQASISGASLVEFDIQLSKDNIPIVYHDWYIEETGYNIAPNELTSAEFLNLHSRFNPAIGTLSSLIKRKEAKSLDDSSIHYRKLEMPSKWPWKGNGDGTIQSEFCLMKHLFTSLDPELGFNVEIKYPFEFESKMFDLVVQDLNLYIDTILELIFELAGSRKIVISSFHPECVIAAKTKQDRYPVLFLTEAGSFNSPDQRCNSYLKALELCLKFDLNGIVTDVKPLMNAPFDLVQLFHKHDLLILSYGGGNNSEENCKMQIQCGMDGVIADDVKFLSGLF